MTRGSSSTGARPAARLPWRRLLGFAGLPLLSAVAPLLLIPVIASVGGASGWSAVALGQILGSGAATILQYGWGFTGPALLARMDADRRPHLLWVSTLSRLMVGVVVVPLTGCAAAVLSPEGYGWLSALTAFGFSTLGFSSHWFFIGLGRAGLAARFETIPRLVTLAAGALGVVMSGELIVYPAVFLAGQIAAIAWTNLRLAAVSGSAASVTEAVGVLKGQRSAAAADLFAALYQSIPTALVAAVAPMSLTVFASADRLSKLAQSGIQPLFHGFQAWVSEGGEVHVKARMRRAVLVTAVFGSAVGASFGALVPLLDVVIFAGEVTIDPAVSTLFGASLALFALTTAVNFYVLSAVAKPGAILISYLTGAIGVSMCVPALAQMGGVTGASVALVLAQLAMLVSQVAPWRRAFREVARAGGSDPALTEE